MAAQGNHFDTGRLLIFKGAPIEEVTIDYLTPLHVASHCGSYEMAKLLLDSKCVVDARARVRLFFVINHVKMLLLFSLLTFSRTALHPFILLVKRTSPES